MDFWDIVRYGWFAFMALAVMSVIGAAAWDATAPKRRLKQLAREKAKRELAAAQAEAAAAEQAEQTAQTEQATQAQEATAETTTAASEEPSVQSEPVSAAD